MVNCSEYVLFVIYLLMFNSPFGNSFQWELVVYRNQSIISSVHDLTLFCLVWILTELNLWTHLRAILVLWIPFDEPAFDIIYTFFFRNNHKLKLSPRKSLICETISKQFARANKRWKLDNPLWEQAKTLLLHRKPKRNAHFWTCQFRGVHYIL